MAFNDREELRSVTEGTLMGAHLIREYEKACDNWETYDVPASYHDPLRSDVPTLLLSGERDPITPPEYGEEVAKHLSRSLHVVQPNAGHGVGGPCVAQLRLQLIITGSVKDLDPSCIRPTSRPNFVVPDAPVERSEIKVAEGILETYVGQYELRPTFSIVVTLEDGQLYGQATGQSRLPLFAESEMQFFLKVVDAQITFTKDDAGVVTGLVLHQNGRDAPARKVR